MIRDLQSKLNIDQTVCFSGHRPAQLPRVGEEWFRMRRTLNDEIVAAIARGKTNFISGAMSGFDVIAAEQVLLLKKEYSQIKCILIAPFSTNYFKNANWTLAWMQRLREVKKHADFSRCLTTN
jgi:uncharacterized phage-like protein YoqJ